MLVEIAGDGTLLGEVLAVSTEDSGLDVAVARLVGVVPPEAASLGDFGPPTGVNQQDPPPSAVWIHRADGRWQKLKVLGKAKDPKFVRYNGRQGEVFWRLDEPVLCSPDVEPGLSGSVVLDQEGYVVGLLVAGDGAVCAYLPIDNVLDSLAAPLGFRPQPVVEARAVDLAALASQTPLVPVPPSPAPIATPPAPPAPVPGGLNYPVAALVTDRAHFAYVQGPVVTALQVALGRAGQSVEPDGVFGKITAGALRRWQAANNLPASDAIDADLWRRLTGRQAPSVFDLCLNLTAAFEGTWFDRIVGNFDKQGLTFGLIGFTLKGGELGRLLKAIERRRTGALRQAFGALLEELDEVLAMSSPTDRVEWGDRLSRGAKKYEVELPWRDAFRRLGSFPEARQVQMEAAFDRYWTGGALRHIDTFMGGRELSVLDAGFWFDVAVQNSLEADERKDLQDVAASGRSGAELRAAFAEVIASHSKEKWRADVLNRKLAFERGVATVHRSGYALDKWGLIDRPVSRIELEAGSTIAELVALGASDPRDSTLEPIAEATEASLEELPAVALATPGSSSPHAGWSDYVDFVAWFGTLGLENFNANEVLYLGSQNEAGPFAKLNTHPPRHLWKNIGPTMTILQRLRSELGARVRIRSAYRSPQYNQAIKGAPQSQHLSFKAIDFVCEIGRPGDWARMLKDYRARGLFQGGIGVYSGFVHLDTQSDNRDWTG
ncbi:D-Ala-D-Ala carboxypeptidase family metallohydrolase [Azospirillum sp.]|uniref:D-Ala-D-Ala carboxypeptidase family metallohydrolase n=1 Tax=Azospirillum sp. TaxID=34012 RepID=UPI002D5F808E|nr:D-Ala-D-Ala carboxypeptidase family metallohydrolase [Azospirillum sp.]HYF86451.1 D-Ala-D-Ala carboxypeptidase family metallohydrolase [Azospirillum sp.]